jgi:phytoene synthase
MDLLGARYETFDDLSLYCYRVASTIGLIAIEIFGYTNPQTRDYAVNLGKALQLVNILRDIQSDARRGRIYLPREDLDEFGVRPSELLSGVYHDPFIELMQFECDRARHFFGVARQFLPPQDRRAMVAAEIMAAIYWRLLARIQKRRYNVFGERVRLPALEKLWIALSVYLGAEWHR